MNPRALKIFRIVFVFWLLGWFCNAPGFLANFFDALKYPLEYTLFPPILRLPSIALIVYLAPLLSILAFVQSSRALLRGTSIVLALLAFFLCLHLETCNDATFVTSFWSALWLVWWTWNGHREDIRFFIHARALAHTIVGVIFLGGAIGKLTGEYRNGEAFFQLYFKDNPAFPYPWLKAHLEPRLFRGLAAWFSRCALSAELVLALSPFLPTRFVFAGVGLTVLTMMSAWTFHLASVLSSLFGLALAAFLIDRELSKLYTENPNELEEKS